jgi:hypothetical protein
MILTTEKGKAKIELEKDEDGVHVKVNDWYRFKFTKDGKVEKHNGIFPTYDETFPFPIDKEGTIKMAKGK